MARINCALSLLLVLLGHFSASAASDNNRTESVVFSPQPLARTRAVPAVQVQNILEDDEEPAIDFAKLALRYLPTSKKISNDECRLDSLAVEQAFKAMEPWALNSEYFIFSLKIEPRRQGIYKRQLRCPLAELEISLIRRKFAVSESRVSVSIVRQMLQRKMSFRNWSSLLEGAN
jgi:hypothetical protein